jgi:hypothetical protein
LSLNQPLIEDLFTKIIGPFAATQLSPLMEEPDSSEDRVSKLIEIFNQYPHFIPAFSALIKSVNPQETDTVLEEKIRFYTTRHTRNWLVVNMMNQVLDVKEIKLDDATGRLPGKPHDLIKFATKAQIAFGEESRYKDQAYAGGLMFDFLFYLQRTTFLNLGQAKFDEPINEAFTLAVEQARLILKLSKYKPKLTLERFALLVPMMRQLSQVSICLLQPSTGPEFYKQMNKLKVPETIRLAMEMKTFGVHSGIVSAYLARSMPSFGELSEVMSVWGAPYLSWVHGHREVHDLSAMGLLGISMNERVKGSEFQGEGVVSQAIAELQYLDLKLTAEVKSEIKI